MYESNDHKLPDSITALAEGVFDFVKTMQHAKVITAYTRVYENPIRLKKGDVTIPGKRDDEYPGWRWCTNSQGIGGWVPEAILAESETGTVATKDYDAMELTVKVGDKLLIETEQNGWLYCVSEVGGKGWVPASHIETNGSPYDLEKHR